MASRSRSVQLAEGGNEKIPEVRKPDMMRFDKSVEFSNRCVKAYMASENVRVRFAYNETKANYSEKFIKTLKSMLYRHFTAKRTYIYKIL